jgi:hypothetical protein
LSARARQALAGAGLLALVTGCVSTRPSRTFPPASADDAQRTLIAWTTVRERAASLPPSRLLYDAKLGTGGAPSVPGTLAVVYDGRAIVTASLTGPFGSKIAEYRDGTVTGNDRRAFVVDPEALRAVLAGAWTDASPVVQGYSDGQGLLAMESGEARVTAIVDVPGERVVSMDLVGRPGRLAVDYSGEPSPWPGRLSIRNEAAGKSLSLKLLAVEPADPVRTSGP